MNSAHPITPRATLPTLPCVFRLTSRDGELLATVHGDWTLDDEAVRQRAVAALADGSAAPRLVERALQHARVRAGLGGAK
jgi:hypothetical protein